MSRGTTDNLAGLIPSKDNALGRAFEELDQKLNAWSAAAMALKERMEAEAATKAETPAPPEAKLSVERPPPVEAPKTVVAARLKEPEPIPVPVSVPVPVTEVQKAADESIAEKPAIEEPAEKTTGGKKAKKVASFTNAETPVDDETLLAALTPDRAESIRARHAFFKGSKTIRELIQEFEDEADDEESLLMSLDPEFAKAVRVKYRLYNGRKTLREVIAEVETSQPKQSQADKKSWWRR
jgi:hypothetical protein